VIAEDSSRRPVIVDTNPASSFVCDYAAGVNRVLSLPPYLLIDNIGRNVELWRFPPDACDPSDRARYDDTAYSDPMASLLDVDIHAAFLRDGGRELLTVNHYGRVRAFAIPPPHVRMHATWACQLLGDMERVAISGDCFIGSSPRGEFTDDPAQPGLFLFEPIGAVDPPRDPPERLRYEQKLADWGVIGALAISSSSDRLAVAADTRLGVFDLAASSEGLQLRDCLWESTLGCVGQWLYFGAGGRLWAGGHRPLISGGGSEDGEACRGGGIHVFERDGGGSPWRVSLPEETAWGYGADPIVLSEGERDLFVLGRDASLTAIDMRTGQSRRLYGAIDQTDTASGSRGIGHAAARGRWIYAGFSRGGFRLLRYDTRPA
jgi:hypothetical protein